MVAKKRWMANRSEWITLPLELKTKQKTDQGGSGKNKFLLWLFKVLIYSVCSHAQALMFLEYSTRVDLHFATCWSLNKLNPDAERIYWEHSHIHQWYSYKDTHTLTCCGAQQVCVCVCAQLQWCSQLNWALTEGSSRWCRWFTYLLLKVICFIYFAGQVYTQPPWLQPSAEFTNYQIFQIWGRENGSMCFFTFHSKMFPLNKRVKVDRSVDSPSSHQQAS